MLDVNNTQKVKNSITEPLIGNPIYINSGIIKAVMKSGDKISVAQIEYQEFDDENFQYVITPYWDIIDGLPCKVLQGIPGIDLNLRLKHYYRVNYIPTFIAERTPSKQREDLWVLMDSVGLNYYDRFEWLLRTKLRSANDNLIVERRRVAMKVVNYSKEVLSELQYGDKIVIESLEAFVDKDKELNNIIFYALTNGLDIETKTGKVIINQAARSMMIPIEINKRLAEIKAFENKRKAGIEEAKKAHKYLGRKPITVDEFLLREVYNEFVKGIITIEEAMKRTNIHSRSTFYRKVKLLK